METILSTWFCVSTFGLCLLWIGSAAKKYFEIDYRNYFFYTTLAFDHKKDVLAEKKKIRLRIAEIKRIKSSFMFKVLQKTYVFAIMSFVISFVSVVMISMTKIIAG